MTVAIEYYYLTSFYFNWVLVDLSLLWWQLLKYWRMTYISWFWNFQPTVLKQAKNKHTHTYIHMKALFLLVCCGICWHSKHINFSMSSMSQVTWGSCIFPLGISKMVRRETYEWILLTYSLNRLIMHETKNRKPWSLYAIVRMHCSIPFKWLWANSFWRC